MEKGDSVRLPVVLYDILQKYSDEAHVITMKEIIGHLQEDYGIQADRRTVYEARDILRENVADVSMKRINGKQGYYMEHLFSSSEALVLLDAIAESSSLSEKETSRISAKIISLLSDHQVQELPEIFFSPSKTDNAEVLTNIEILMNAISSHHKVRFLYYDTVVTDDARTGKHYRKDKKNYEIEPYGITSGNGRFYCISYNRKHQNQTIYRIDKIQKIHESDETFDPVPFDIQEYVRRSVQMFGGESQSVTAVFSRKIASNVFDEFGNSKKSIIIEHVDQDTFQATVRTSLTPVVTGWFLQFYQDAKVLGPEEFRRDLLHIAETLEKNYNN